MTPTSTTSLALDGAGIDGGLYTSITDFARDTRWLNGPMLTFTSIGVGLFAVFMLVGWWLARKQDAAGMATALAAPVATVIAYLANATIKTVFTEPRPCRALPHDFLIEKCPELNDYAFPSNHTTVVAAVTVALFLVNKRLGALSAVVAVVMGFSRVYVGAHYPHDVLVGAVVGAVVGAICTLLARRFAAPLIERLRNGALRPLLIAPTPGRRRAGGGNRSRQRVE